MSNDPLTTFLSFALLDIVVRHVVLIYHIISIAKLKAFTRKFLNLPSYFTNKILPQ